MNGEVTAMAKLPGGWVWTTVADVYDIVGGGTPSTAVAEYWEGDIPWITSADIFGLRDIRPRRQITRQAIENSATHLVPAGSLIIVTRVGLGKIALTKTPICFSQDSQALVCSNISLFRDYSLYCLSEAVQVFKYKHRGTTINGVTKKQLAELMFPVPPLAEQHRIVAKIEELLTRLDAGVQAVKKVKAQLRRYRQSVLKCAFEGKLTAGWRQAHKHELEPASILLERIKQERQKTAKGKYKGLPSIDISDLHKLPAGWLWTITSVVCSSVRDGTHDTPKYVEQGIPLVTSKNLTEHGLDFTTARNISIEDHKRISVRSGVDEGDVLFAMIGTIGSPVVVPTSREFSIKNVGLFKKNEARLDSDYLGFWLASQSLKEILEAKKLLKGTTQRFIPLEHLRILPVPFTSPLEQHRIVEEVERRFSVADEIEKTVDHTLKQAERLRQSILRKASEGKLAPQDPNDEPAEKLLERIKLEKSQREKIRGKIGRGHKSK